MNLYGNSFDLVIPLFLSQNSSTGRFLLLALRSFDLIVYTGSLSFQGEAPDLLAAFLQAF